MKATLEPRKCKLEALRISQQSEQTPDRLRLLRATYKKTPDPLFPSDWLVIHEDCRLGKRSFKPTKGGQHQVKVHIKKSMPFSSGPWTREEDELLMSLVLTHGHQKWSNVAKRMVGREGKQCRERWHNHLSPSIKKTPWTETEQWVLFLVSLLSDPEP